MTTHTRRQVKGRCRCCHRPLFGIERKQCVECGKWFYRSDRGDSYVDFATKKFCSRACQHAGYRRQHTTLCMICGKNQKPHGARGLCATHYMAWRRDKGSITLDDYYIQHAFNLPASAPKALLELCRNVLKLRRGLAPDKRCTKRGCHERHLARGLCKRHYSLWRRLNNAAS